jgi:hypothetical protein
MKITYKKCAQAGIAYYVFLIISSTLPAVNIGKETSLYPFWVDSFLYIILAILTVPLFWGFIKMAKEIKSKKLLSGSWLSIILSTLYLPFAIYGDIYPPSENLALTLTYVFTALIIVGLATFIYGAGVKNLESNLGKAAKTTGRLTMFTGLSLASIVLLPIGVILIFIIVPLQIKLLKKADKIKTWKSMKPKPKGYKKMPIGLKIITVYLLIITATSIWSIFTIYSSPEDLGVMIFSGYIKGYFFWIFTSIIILMLFSLVGGFILRKKWAYKLAMIYFGLALFISLSNFTFYNEIFGETAVAGNGEPYVDTLSETTLQIMSAFVTYLIVSAAVIVNGIQMYYLNSIKNFFKK